MDRYPKRLIEVDLPIHRISEHAQNEKNLRSGHPWHLHIWWARRPWGACRAVALASLLPAPVDDNCPEIFVRKTREILSSIGFKPAGPSRENVQDSLLKFVGEFACWELGGNSSFRSAARQLVKAAFPDHAPMVFDSFSGYGAIPGEAARLGCESMAMDLNPVAILCMRTLLEAVPRHGHALIERFEEGAAFIKQQAVKRLSEYYPRHKEKTSIAWLWARTVTCEGPKCGAEIPLISQTVIAKGARKAWIEITGDKKTKEVHIHVKQGKTIPHDLVKTAGGGNAVCPVCGFTTEKGRVKVQGKARKMAHRLYGVALAIGDRQGKEYTDATVEDIKAYERAERAWQKIARDNPVAEIKERYPAFDPRAFTAGLYGIETWGDLFSPRQKLALHTAGKILREYHAELKKEKVPDDLARDVVTALALAVSNGSHYSTNMSTWLAEHMISAFITGNAIAMRWDWAEANPLAAAYVGGLDYAFEQGLEALRSVASLDSHTAVVTAANAANLPMPDDAAEMFFTDPPYYDVVPYADLSDLCYVWLKRFVGDLHPDLLSDDLTPKAEQIVVNPYAVNDGRGDQSPQRYQERMTQAFSEGRRVLKTDGIGAIVFAHKGTAAWEALLASIIDAGFVVTASWPIHTERAARMRANKSAALGSSVHLIVRPRESLQGISRTEEVGELRGVLAELPEKTKHWMRRLIKEGVVGADAIFACLGPALEIFSRYTRVERSNGERFTLREYLEQVWGAIAKEALKSIFEGADATGFEEDSRLTAMWLWTLRTEVNGGPVSEKNELDESEKKVQKPGFSLEFDAANKIAKGLGIYLEKLNSVVEIMGDEARLLSVAERTQSLFGKEQSAAPTRQRKKDNQLELFKNLVEEGDTESAWGEKTVQKVGDTALDRLHQSMILFAAGRSEALKRFLVEDGIGRNPLFWRLAQALSALYPTGTDEKRWVDGVLARKKGLGF